MKNDPAKNLEYFMSLPYATEVVPQWCTDGSRAYLALHPDLPNCMSHGDTPREALENLKEARELYLQTMLETQQTPPLPEIKAFAFAIWQIMNQSQSVLNENTLQHWPTEFSPLGVIPGSLNYAI